MLFKVNEKHVGAREMMGEREITPGRRGAHGYGFGAAYRWRTAGGASPV